MITNRDFYQWLPSVNDVNELNIALDGNTRAYAFVRGEYVSALERDPNIEGDLVPALRGIMETLQEWECLMLARMSALLLD